MTTTRITGWVLVTLSFLCGCEGASTADHTGQIAPSSSGQAGGASSAGASGAPPVDPSAPPSCRYRQAGAGLDCSADKNIDCCASALVPGGRSTRNGAGSDAVRVDPFQLDLFEVTRGRFRAFIEAYPSSRPSPGAGAHPKYPASGWQAEWDAHMPGTKEELLSRLKCEYQGRLDLDRWDSPSGEAEWLPASCVPWLLMFSFCVWDGGRLPSDAERKVAQVGGEENRRYPWGNEEGTPDLVALDFPPQDEDEFYLPVGSHPRGRARWGHFDMLGSRSEFILDRISQPDLRKSGGNFQSSLWSCEDCVMLPPSTTPVEEQWGFFQDVPGAVTAKTGLKLSPLPYRSVHPISKALAAVGARCARDP